MSNSIFLNFIYRIYGKLNIFYENSLYYRFIKKICFYSVNSFLGSRLYKLFCVKEDKKYSDNSLFISFIFKICECGTSFFCAIYNFFKNKNVGSLNCRIYKNLILPINNIGIIVCSVSSLISGVFITYIVSSIIKNGFHMKNLIFSFILFLVFFIISLINSDVLKSFINRSSFVKLFLYVLNIRS